MLNCTVLTNKIILQEQTGMGVNNIPSLFIALAALDPLQHLYPAEEEIVDRKL